MRVNAGQEFVIGGFTTSAADGKGWPRTDADGYPWYRRSGPRKSSVTVPLYVCALRPDVLMQRVGVPRPLGYAVKDSARRVLGAHGAA